MAGRHDERGGGVDRDRNHDQPDTRDLRTFCAVKAYVMTATSQAGGEVADERLGSARLLWAERRHWRCDDSDLHEQPALVWSSKE
jgi:hypothetical protein